MNKITTAIALLSIGFASCSDVPSTKLDAPIYKSLLTINIDYLKTIESTERRTKAIIAILKQKLTESNSCRIAGKPPFDRALILDECTDTLCKKIDSLKVFLIAKAYNISIESADTLNIPDLGMSKNIDVSDTYMVTNPQDRTNSRGIAHDLKLLIARYRHMLTDFIAPSDTVALHINLLTPDHFDRIEDRKVTWEYWHFFHLPLLSLLANLNGLESDIRIAENAVVNQQMYYVLQEEALLNKTEGKDK